MVVGAVKIDQMLVREITGIAGGNMEGGIGGPEVGSVDRKGLEGAGEVCCKVGREITIGSAAMEGFGSARMTGNWTESGSLAMYTCFPFDKGNQGCDEDLSSG